VGKTTTYTVTMLTPLIFYTTRILSFAMVSHGPDVLAAVLTLHMSFEYSFDLKGEDTIRFTYWGVSLLLGYVTSTGVCHFYVLSHFVNV
jgi:hypothetical protein